MSDTTSRTSIADRLRGERILLTGTTGFLSKAVLEKLLRSVRDVDRIYVLIRGKSLQDAAQRLTQEVFGSRIFDRLRTERAQLFERMIQKKIVPIEGDLGLDQFGLSTAMYRELCDGVSLVINAAAACSFREQLDRALHVNTLGPTRLLQFARDAGNIPFLHVSTCYVNGSYDSDFSEEVLPTGHTVKSFTEKTEPTFDLDQEVDVLLNQCAAMRERIMSGGRDHKLRDSADSASLNPALLMRLRRDYADQRVAELGARTARHLGWPDVYSFTKCLGEQLLVRDRGAVPLTIFRPSIIESTVSEPVPGWIDTLRMADPVISEFGKGNLDQFVGDPNANLDLIPCDMVANGILAAVPPSGRSDFCEVYQLATSSANPLSLLKLAESVREAYIRHPVTGRDGQPIMPAPFRWISAREFKRDLQRQARRLHHIRHQHLRVGLKDRARRITAHLRILSRLKSFGDLYEPYTVHSPRFLTTNIQRLYRSLSSQDRTTFPFDVSKLDWLEYFTECHIPGLHRMTRKKASSETEKLANTKPESDRPNLVLDTDDERRKVSA